ncbi:MAG TPA: DUF4388 domain-containing protein, partial [Candidatus Eisenbacteria bacterium]|nr:DUF4388 domain-containing protein [Candidatus Eisenbacteria bacterium]
MALEGNVKDFGLSEIFQLIALQKKSGMLSVTADETVVIFFREGMLVSTRDRRGDLRDPLKEYLTGYGFLTKEETARIEKIQKETGMDLTEILLSEKYFSEDELSTIFVDQIQETMQEVLNWPKSYYKFNIGNQVLQNVKSFASIKVEGLLMESMRRIDEFPEMLRIFPSEKMTVRRLPTPAVKPPALDRQEEIVYELIEDGDSIEHLVSTAKMARFCTYEALKNLLEKGLLEIGEMPVEETQEVEEPVKKTVKRRKMRVVPTLATMLFLIACFAVGEYLVPMLLPPGWSVARSGESADGAPAGGAFIAADLGELNKRLAVEALREGIETHMALKGSYPITLELLAVRNIIPSSLLDEAQRYGIVYRMFEESGSY